MAHARVWRADVHDAVCGDRTAAALRSNFGVALEGPVSEIVVRNWGALIGLVGAMLIYVAIAVDAAWVMLFVGYFIGMRNTGRMETSVRSV